MNKHFFVRVFGEQKHPNPKQDLSKMSTKEYFEREKEKENNALPRNNQISLVKIHF